MLLLLASLVSRTTEAVLATFVATRAWDYRPARLFVLLVAVLIVLNLASFMRIQATEPRTAYAIATISSIMLAALDLLLLLVLSALFMPEWWKGSRPIRWISA